MRPLVWAPPGKGELAEEKDSKCLWRGAVRGVTRRIALGMVGARL